MSTLHPLPRWAGNHAAHAGPGLQTMPLWGSLLLTASLALEPAPEQDVAAALESCNCTGPMDFQDFQAAPLAETCCLNFTSSNITHLDWGTVAGVRGLRELYLSHCSITAISNAQVVTPTLEILHLSHNQLESLPGSFLEGAPNLKVLYLDRNQLQELPKSFLRASTQVREVYLGFNALTFLPDSLLQPSLLQLQLSNNSWDCSCALLSTLRRWPGLDIEVVCHTPERYRGAHLRSIPRDELCRSHGLTALLICLPLLLILASVACCFCRRRRRTNYSFQSGPEGRLAAAETGSVAAPAEPHHYVPYELPAAPTGTEKKVLLGSRLLLQPSVALLESGKDLYEEVEIPAGSLGPASAGPPGAEQGPPAFPRAEELAGSAAEAETVSVSDVLRDSADREKMYMSQQTDYYNLVPGIELEDSDNLEYENIDPR